MNLQYGNNGFLSKNPLNLGERLQSDRIDRTYEIVRKLGWSSGSSVWLVKFSRCVRCCSYLNWDNSLFQSHSNSAKEKHYCAVKVLTVNLTAGICMTSTGNFLLPNESPTQIQTTQDINIVSHSMIPSSATVPWSSHVPRLRCSGVKSAVSSKNAAKPCVFLAGYQTYHQAGPPRTGLPSPRLWLGPQRWAHLLLF